MAMKSNEIRQKFFDYFADKGHKIVPSAPLVIKDDPTLMFTNAGMNQFKDYFLGDKKPDVRRVADTQKCLRVSGKHNDLEEVGRDSYHHTMFEMLGNWSFGDYFKKESIHWAWDLLTEVYGLEKERLYVTVFGGDENEGLGPDQNAADIWKEYVPEERILFCSKKDNFWEMGDVGPCGPCSEIHVDLRSEKERKEISGATLVNMDDPMVIEIWNLVFIQFNRKADGSLQELTEKHIDTGMGFERLCMALQGKHSNYDTDVFTPFIQYIEEYTKIPYKGSYKESAKTDIAMRVIVDHLRAVSFAIADGEMPSNNGAGYVIRRILRRAVRYYYSFLNVKEPFIYSMVEKLGEYFKDVFPELKAQHGFVSKVIMEEEKSFLRTLEGGLKRIDNLEIEGNLLDGKQAFELYDTYGFPFDLTQLMAGEEGFEVDEKGFDKALAAQKGRSKADAEKDQGDWTTVNEGLDVTFVGYDNLEADTQILRYREVSAKGKTQYQLVLNNTPFYPEGGGQIGDTGELSSDSEKVYVINTKKENDLILHFVKELPKDLNATFKAKVNAKRRRDTEKNHSVTHLVHSALRKVLGDHVAQKGSLVGPDYMRFDFSHFAKMTAEEIEQVELIVNAKIRENIALKEDRNIPIAKAQESGAMMLFGEKYGDTVRMITFDPSYSIELCGGTHVNATGEIGLCRITSEGAVAAGVRRIEVVTGEGAELLVRKEQKLLAQIKDTLKAPKDPIKSINTLIEDKKALEEQLQQFKAEKVKAMKDDLIAQFEPKQELNLLVSKVNVGDAAQGKDLAFQLAQAKEKAVVVLAAAIGAKANLWVYVDKELTQNKELDARAMIKSVSAEIRGGGGGQPFFASAGGKNPEGIDKALELIKEQF